MKTFLLSVLLPVSAVAGPFVVSDPHPVGAQYAVPTHCGYILDSGAKIDVPVESTTNGMRCKIDVGTVTTGAHVVKATFVRIDSLWGRLESPESSPLAFTKPGSPTVPSGMGLIP